MAFLLIEWPNETPKKYSVVSSEKLEDGSLRGDLRSIIGDIVQIVWTRGKIYPGLVLNIGTYITYILKSNITLHIILLVRN